MYHMPLSFPSPLPLQHETAMRGKMPKAVTVRTTGLILVFLPSNLCKMTSASEYSLLIATILVIILLSGSMVFGKSQIQVSERSRVQFVLWAAWGLKAYFPRSSPSSWDKQEFVGTAWPAKGRLSEYWLRARQLPQTPAASALLFQFSVP